MKIVLIGAGNVGWHLGHRLKSCRQELLQVYSRGAAKAGELASRLGVPFTADLKSLNPAADLYILAVQDDAIPEVAAQLAVAGVHNKLIVHTSGATSMQVFSGKFQRYGVFYPLQTFTKGRETDFEMIPLCIDAKEEADLQMLSDLAGQLSRAVFRISDEERAVLHVAAVFVNNFTNHLFHIGHSILEKENLPFELLLPLIQETAAKVLSAAPGSMQTGPAQRGDEATIRQHLDYLEKFPRYRQLYEAVTKSIRKT